MTQHEAMLRPGNAYLVGVAPAAAGLPYAELAALVAGCLETA